MNNTEPLSWTLADHIEDVQQALANAGLADREYHLMMQLTEAFIDLALGVDPDNEISAGERGTMKPRDYTTSWDDEEEGKPAGRMRSRRGVLRDLDEAQTRVLHGLQHYQSGRRGPVRARREAA